MSYVKRPRALGAVMRGGQVNPIFTSVRTMRGLSGVSSQPYGPPIYHAFAGVPVARRGMLGGVSSQPSGARVATAMGLAVVGPAIGVVRGAAMPPKPVKRAALNFSRVTQSYAMGGIFGDDEPSILDPIVSDTPPPAAPPVTLEQKVDDILARQKEEQRARKLSQLVAIGGALFAAARLGIIALPMIKSRIKGGGGGEGG